MTNRYFTLANLLLITLAVYFGVSIFYAVATSRLTGSPPPIPAGRTEAPAGSAAVWVRFSTGVLVAMSMGVSSPGQPGRSRSSNVGAKAARLAARGSVSQFLL